MKETLTKKQKNVLELIYNFLINSGFPPTLADLKAELGVSSNQAVLNFLEILEKKQCIKREEGQARSIKILHKILVLNTIFKSSSGAFEKVIPGFIYLPN